MSMPFEQLSAYLAKMVIDREGSYDSLLSLGVNPNDWPDGLPKKAMLEYGQYRDLEDHQYAAWMLTKGLTLDHLNDLAQDAFLPGDEAVVRREYEESFRLYRAHSLVAALSRDPKNAEHIVQEYLNGLSSEVETLSLEERFDETTHTAEQEVLERLDKITIPNWPVLSDKIGGFNPGRFGVLMADSGFGKTTIATKLSLEASEIMGVAYFNMEMSEKDFVKRLHALITETPFARLYREGWPKELGRERSSRKKFFYTVGRSLTLAQIKAKVRTLKRTQGIKFVVIDYDQKLTLTQRGKEEWKQLQEAAEDLDAFSREVDCYILLLAQTNFEGGLSGSKRVAFPAHHVLYFSRDDEGVVTLRATKNRHGPTNAVVRVDYRVEESIVREAGAGVYVPTKKAKITR